MRIAFRFLLNIKRNYFKSIDGIKYSGPHKCLFHW